VAAVKEHYDNHLGNFYSFVNVTDLLHEKNAEGWKQKISSYKKARVRHDEIVEIIEKKWYGHSI